MKYFTLSLAFVLITLSATAQKPLFKYGKVSNEELKMTEYHMDTTAGAVVLGDFGVTRFAYSAEGGFYLNFTTHIRIKILDKSELDQADFSIELYHGDGGQDEDLTLLKATTFNLENGEVVKTKLKSSEVYKEHVTENHELVKFSLPNVKVGSVLDVTYTVASPFTFTLNPWYFQGDIPVVKSEYHVFIPEYYYYKNWTSGYVKIEKESERVTENYQFSKGAVITSTGRQSGGIYNIEAQVSHWKYTATNVPAFVNEPYITTPRDYLSAVEFELVSTDFPGSIKKYYTSTWEKINEELLDQDNFGRQIQRNGHLKEDIERIASMSDDPLVRLQAAFEFIKNSIAWTNMYSRYPDDNLRKAYMNKEGNSADINLNLVALLQGLELDAHPVLVSTRSNGKLRPGLVIKTQFNHVVAGVSIGDNTYVLDAIDYYCPINILPPNTLNDKGFMVRPDGYRWVDLYSNQPSSKIAYISATINDDLEFEGIFQQSQENFLALNTRKAIHDLSDIEEYSEKMEETIEGFEAKKLTIENLDSIYEPLKIESEFILRDRITEGGGFLYFNPILVARWEENPFKNDDRKFPIDFNYPLKARYTASITLPEGYAVEELPENIAVGLPNEGGIFKYHLKALGNRISVNYSYSINETLFPATNYMEIKKFFEMMVSKLSEQVVLREI